MEASRIVSFGPYRLDGGAERLWRGSQTVKLTPKALAALCLLLVRPGQVVTKDELFHTVWPETVVSDDALTFCIQELRQALRDNAKRPRYIETVYRRGFRFIAPVSTAQPVRSAESGVRSQNFKPVPNPQHLAPTLVGRERELEQLQRWLDTALNGERQIVFVTGEPGIGKTTLVEAFLENVGAALRGRPTPGQPHRVAPTQDPWIARGQCIEHYGAGEGYLPLLEALGRLCRESGGRHLIELLGQHAPTWLGQMPALLSTPEVEALQPRILGASQERMLRELAEAFEVLTAERPVVLWLEDLQWSDVSTLDFLSALARRQEPCRLLVLGTYRPVDVFVRQHPLRVIKQELQLHGCCQELALDFLQEGEVSKYLEQRFAVGATGRSPLQRLAHFIYQRTDGNPLFMVNLVEHFLSQGVLERIDGHWTVNQAEPTAAVPESLRQMIEQRLAQVPPSARTVLEVASVVGVEFSVAAVAAGVESTVEAVEEQCAELARQEQFLGASGMATWPDGTVAARYRFRHALYQDVLYEWLSAGRRQRLHQRLGERIEQGYGERTTETAAELAVHFEQGQDYQRAVQYLWQAAQNALRRSADREAISLLTRALALLHTLPDTPQRNEQELQLQVTLGVPLLMTKGYAALEVKGAYARARELCRQVGESPQLAPVLTGLSRFYTVRAEFRTATELGEELLRLGHQTQDPGSLLGAYMMLGATSFFQGEFARAQTYAEQGLTLYDPQQHRGLIFLYGDDPQLLCSYWVALALWYLGYPDQAVERIYQALRFAQELAHPYSLTMTLFWTAFLHHHRGEVQSAQEQLTVLQPLAQEYGIPHSAALGTGLRGWVLAEQGHREEGIAQIQRGLAGLQAMGQELGPPQFLSLLAEAYSKGGQVEEGMRALTEALEIVYKGGESMHQAELYRLKGELTLQQERQRAKDKGQKAKVPDTQHLAPNTQAEVKQEAERCFLKALEIARQQQAKSLELRAGMSLSRLWQSQDKKQEAHQMLAEVYHWFTEGFDTKDLQDAKALLAELAG